MQINGLKMNKKIVFRLYSYYCRPKSMTNCLRNMFEINVIKCDNQINIFTTTSNFLNFLQFSQFNVTNRIFFAGHL